MTGSSFAPLRHRDFGRIWTASVLSNFGLLINGVAAGWAMTEMSDKAQDVALVQTALMLPLMMFAVPAGAISDTYDRRKVSIAMLLFACLSAGILMATTLAGWLTPTLLLVLCFLTGTANAMFNPAWQSSVGEQVPPEDLPPAVALNSISYNIARSFGPAVGGLIVAAAGADVAFGVTAVCYLPIMLALYLWKRRPDPPRLPPERIRSAIMSGIRYAFHSPSTRKVLVRSAIIGLFGASTSSLMPLIARDMLGGSAAIYGVLLGAFGIGAVLGALMMPAMQSRLSFEQHVAGSLMALGTAVILLSFVRSIWTAVPLLVLAGGFWMQPLMQFNIVIQTQAPRWVTGRALASYQAAIAGGVAVGAWMWGRAAEHLGTAGALGVSGLGLVCCVALTWLFRLPSDVIDSTGREPLPTPKAQLAITGRSGPIMIEIEYEVDPARARAFYTAMLEVASFRQRNGAYEWTLARDIEAEQHWVERFSCPTWHDYLRQRDRMTIGDQAMMDRALEETVTGASGRVRRLLERPVGSVRWRSESRDNGLWITGGGPAGPS